MDCPGCAVLEHNALAGLELGELAGTMCSDRCLALVDEVLLGIPTAHVLWMILANRLLLIRNAGLGGRKVVG